MQPSYDADDFMRRGFFGSFMGFRKRSSSKTDTVSSSSSSQAHPKFVPPPVVVQPPPEPVPVVTTGRTEYDIYREIVHEAHFIERSAPTTPDFSCPTTPQPSSAYFPPPPPHNFEHPNSHLLVPPTPDMMSQYHMVMSPIAPHPIPVDTNGVPLGNQCPMAPPPYSSFAPQSSSPMPQLPAAMANVPFDVKREIQEHLVLQNGKQQMSIEEIVKLVVVALKDSQLDESREEESPEEILRRKRVQNNLAAARYRKRQREARECAEQELGELTKRNDELREQVQRMEHQIRELKNAVLNRNNN